MTEQDLAGLNADDIKMLLSAKSSNDQMYQQAVGLYLDNKVNERNYQRGLQQDAAKQAQGYAELQSKEALARQAVENQKAAKTLEFQRDLIKERIKDKLAKNKSPEDIAKDQLELAKLEADIGKIQLETDVMAQKAPSQLEMDRLSREDIAARTAKTRKETGMLGQDKPATRSERIAQRRLELAEAESDGRLTKDFEKDIGKFLDDEVPQSQADVISARLNNDPNSNVLLYTNDKWIDERDMFQIPQGTKYKGQQVTPQMMLGMAHYWRKPNGKKYTITEVVDIIKGMSGEE